MENEREDRVRKRAYALWENEGRPEGRSETLWAKAEQEVGGDPDEGQYELDDVDRAAGPSHGNRDFGGHDAEAEGSAKAGMGPEGEHSQPRTKQAGTDEPEVGEERVLPG